eukprot:11623108-Heterocapsa_arctica.AAC.1
MDKANQPANQPPIRRVESGEGTKILRSLRKRPRDENQKDIPTDDEVQAAAKAIHAWLRQKQSALR